MNRVAVVTGAASGMGEAIARHLALDGHSVALFDIDDERAASVADCLNAEGLRALACRVDVTDRSTVDEAVAKARSELGPVEIVVTSAGRSRFEPFESITVDSWQSVFDVNLLGTFHVIQAAIAGMVASSWGRIVTISSSSGQQGAHRAAHYAASKGAVITLTKALAKEYGRRGITVNNIAPSLIETPMQQAAQSAGNIPDREAMAARSLLRRLGTVDEVAATCAFLCSDGAGYITGQVIGVNGGSVL
ncbi:MAG TPA: SDR family NAD(P)-dependent oxidoreductase [Acidimicrobiia bacterium]|jgi:2-hydroxycyclohexanecarboxyl-CoA dehydrogenase